MNDNLYFIYGEKEINHLRKMDKKLGAWDKSSVIRFALDFFVHFAGFEGEY